MLEEKIELYIQCVNCGWKEKLIEKEIDTYDYMDEEHNRTCPKCKTRHNFFDYEGEKFEFINIEKYRIINWYNPFSYIWKVKK